MNDITEYFVQLFQSVYTRETELIYGAMLPNTIYLEKVMSTIEFTPEKVEEAFKSFQTDTSPEPNDIPKFFVVKCVQTVSWRLSVVIHDTVKE